MSSLLNCRSKEARKMKAFWGVKDCMREKTEDRRARTEGGTDRQREERRHMPGEEKVL